MSDRDTNKFNFHEDRNVYSPRKVKFWECCIAETTYNLIKKPSAYYSKRDNRHQFTSFLNEKIDDDEYILNKAYNRYRKINENHFGSDIPKRDNFYKGVSEVIKNGNEEIIINEIHVNSKNKFDNNPIIAIANTKVDVKNIELSIKGTPNLDNARLNKISKLFNETRNEKADILILPECSVPYEWVSSLAKYSANEQKVIIAGLEHWNIEGVCYNFIVTILPVIIDGVKDAVVGYRLKNHYSHFEELMIKGFGYVVPKPNPYRYDLINFRNLYFSSYYCFELADTFHRSLFRSKVDLLIASEWNKDTPYFSNIVETLSRDLHCYFAQVNTSQYGDSRLTQPTQTARKDIMKLKGGNNDIILVEEINIKKLRDFQLKYFERIKADNDTSFKPLPPDWNRDFVNKRIENKNIYK